MPPTKRLYLRLFLPYSATLVLAMVLAWVIAIQLLTNTLERRLENQLGHAAQVLSEGNFPFTDTVLERLEKLLRARILMLPHAGQPDPQGDQAALIRNLYRAWSGTDRSGVSLHHLDDGGIPYLAAVGPAPAGLGDRYAAVAALASLEDVRAASHRAAWWLGGAALIGTLALAWLGHRVASSITVPVGKLVDLSERIAAGDRTARVHLPQHDEIGALSEALNHMAERLQIYEQEAADRNRLVTLGEMAARVAHEIRNPLTAIRLQLQLLGESLAPTEHARVTRLLGELDRLELIVSGTLTMARPRRLETRSMQLSELVREVCDLMSPQLAHRHILLDEQVERVPPLSLDGDRIKQVIFNLFANAADVLPDGGTIRVRTETGEAEVILTVEDSGPGIDPEHRERLFNGTAGGKATSLGVGLLLCRELVELHGGRIDADNSPDLGGARFRVRLPLGTVKMTE